MKNLLDSYKPVLMFATVVNLLVFFPVFDWPNPLTWLGFLASFIFMILFAWRISKMQGGSRKYLLFALFILLLILFLIASGSAGMVLYEFMTDPLLSQDDLASFKWFLPLLFYVAHALTLGIICISEIFFLKTHPINN